MIAMLLVVLVGLVILVMFFWLLSRKRLRLAAAIAIALVVLGALMFSQVRAISGYIIVAIPEGVGQAEAHAIVEQVLKPEHVSDLYGAGFKNHWLDNIQARSISADLRLIELILIDTGWKSEINKQRRLAELLQQRIANLLDEAAARRKR